MTFAGISVAVLFAYVFVNVGLCWGVPALETLSTLVKTKQVTPASVKAMFLNKGR